MDDHERTSLRRRTRAPFPPASRRAPPAPSRMRRDGHHRAVVLDEDGGTAGIVTPEDPVEELIGDIRDEYDVQDAQARRLHGGVVGVDGLLGLDDFAAGTGVRTPAGPCETVAGPVIAVPGGMSAEGDGADAPGGRPPVVRSGGRRVARVRVVPRRPHPAQAHPEALASPRATTPPEVPAPPEARTPPEVRAPAPPHAGGGAEPPRTAAGAEPGGGRSGAPAPEEAPTSDIASNEA